MSERRLAILEATRQAAHVVSKFPVGQRTSFDVVAAVTELDIPLLYRPLKKLWGATVTLEGDRGILVTSVIPRALQRFTLAHELGHVLLGHELSLDETVNGLGQIDPHSQPIPELAADTFASALLAPKPLVLASARRHGWTKDALGSGRNVYQLALRLGISYQATCWALVGHNAINVSQARALQKVAPKEFKSELCPREVVGDSWADVWSLTANDTGTLLEAGPEDVFALRLHDDASSGYLWEFLGGGENCTVVQEQVVPPTENYGALSERVLLLRLTGSGRHRLTFEHRRPWNQQTIGHIDIDVDNYGKETGGYARRVRDQALQLGAA